MLLPNTNFLSDPPLASIIEMVPCLVMQAKRPSSLPPPVCPLYSFWSDTIDTTFSLVLLNLWMSEGDLTEGQFSTWLLPLFLSIALGSIFFFFFSKERWRNRSLRKNSSGPALMTIYTQRSECTSLLLVLHEIKGRRVRTLTREDREWIEKCLFWPVVAGCGSERLF